jgi:hypothetical protein
MWSTVSLSAQSPSKMDKTTGLDVVFLVSGTRAACAAKARTSFNSRRRGKGRIRSGSTSSVIVPRDPIVLGLNSTSSAIPHCIGTAIGNQPKGHGACQALSGGTLAKSLMAQVPSRQASTQGISPYWLFCWLFRVDYASRAPR